MIVKIDEDLVNRAVETLWPVTAARFPELSEGTVSVVTERAVNRYLAITAVRKLAQVAENVVTGSDLRDVLQAITAAGNAELIRQAARQQKGPPSVLPDSGPVQNSHGSILSRP